MPGSTLRDLSSIPALKSVKAILSPPAVSCKVLSQSGGFITDLFLKAFVSKQRICIILHFPQFFSAVIQDYDSDVGLEYVILGNDVLFKCKTPSFVDDFVSIVSWIVDDEDTALDRGKESSIVVTAHCSQGNLRTINH